MKITKKLVALVGVVACCFFVLNPVSVNAAKVTDGVIPLCNHELTSEILCNEYSYDWETTTHEFRMDYHNGEEWIEDAWFECYKKIIYQVYKRSCACGERTEYVTRTMVQHSDPDCPYY